MVFFYMQINFYCSASQTNPTDGPKWIKNTREDDSSCGVYLVRVNLTWLTGTDSCLLLPGTALSCKQGGQRGTTASLNNIHPYQHSQHWRKKTPVFPLSQTYFFWLDQIMPYIMTESTGTQYTSRCPRTKNAYSMKTGVLYMIGPGWPVPFFLVDT